LISLWCYFWNLFCQFVASCCGSFCCKSFTSLHCRLIVASQSIGLYTHKIQSLLQVYLLHLMFHTNNVVAIQPFKQAKPWGTFLPLIFTNSCTNFASLWHYFWILFCQFVAGHFIVDLFQVYYMSIRWTLYT
jgi:hypothetical protein